MRGEEGEGRLSRRSSGRRVGWGEGGRRWVCERPVLSLVDGWVICRSHHSLLSSFGMSSNSKQPDLYTPLMG